MRVCVFVRGEAIVVACGEGNQRVKWLAIVALQRYESTLGGPLSHKHVPVGLATEDGTALGSNDIIARVLTNDQAVYVRLQEDDKLELGAAGALIPLGTSSFLVSQGASAARCSLSGRGVGHCLLNETTHVFVIARDTYGNLSRNGGDHFTMRSEGPGALACTVRDLGDGAYRCSFKADKAGMYTCYIELEGVDIDGSPFTTIVTRRPEILRLKWNQPTLSGDESRPVACAVSVAIGRRILMFGGSTGEGPSNALRVLHSDKIKWADIAKTEAGPTPPPLFAAASALVGTRLFVYGGELRQASSGKIDPSFTPYDGLWAFDIASTEWSQLEPTGIAPGPRSFSAAAAIGNSLYLFGGWTGERVSNSLHTLKTNSSLPQWEPAQVSPASAYVAPRLGHTLTAMGEKLFLYGGRAADPNGKAAILSDIAIFDTSFRGGGVWSAPQTSGEGPRERWLHSSGMIGERLVLFGGYDNAGESSAFAFLDINSLRWDSWASNSARAGGSLHVVDGRALVVGGLENGKACDDVLQFNLGGFQLEFDGERGEAMVPHPSPLLQPKGDYTIEAWICPARGNVPMSILCKSSGAYPMSVWSHQLRINERGQLQHSTLLVDGEHQVVVSNVALKTNAWTHVAGAASPGGKMTLYINGVEDEDTVQEVGPITATLDRFFIGSKTGHGMGMFQGVIAEVRVWNIFRKPEEVKEDMKRHLTGSESGLCGYWKLNEGPGDSVLDSSLSDNHGALMGNPLWNAAHSPMAGEEPDAAARPHKGR